MPALLLAALALLAQAPTPKADTPLRVLLVYGGHDFQEREFFAFWDALPGVVVTRAPLPASAHLLTPELRKTHDAVVLYDMYTGFTPDQKKAFAALAGSGIGFVALHHSLCSHRDWEEYRHILGGKWVAKAEVIDGKSYPPSTFSHGEDIPVKVADPDHPVTRGLRDYVIHDETYGGTYVDPKAHVLLTTDHPRSARPVAWTWPYGKTRVVYLQSGHDARAWRNPVFRELVLRSLKWSVGGGVDTRQPAR